jgi:hypothetical protein
MSAEVQVPPPSTAPVTTAPWDAEATGSWFEPGASRREPSPADEPADPILSTTPREPEPPGPASSGRHLGMPIRVPRASLAPQLRARRGAGPQEGAEDQAPEVHERSPEATRNMLTLMQQGWRHGRVDDLDDPEGAPGLETDR